MKALNFKLIFLLSMFGLAMALATVWVIPSNIEPAFWLVIFGVCAVLIARNAPGHFFLHGFLTSCVNCVWITSAHILFVQDYLARHPDELKMLETGPMPDHPRAMMAVMGPIIGVISGLVLGLFAFIAAKVMKKGAPAT